jgi:DNA-binding NarL/FixJ family response regulator
MTTMGHDELIARAALVKRLNEWRDVVAQRDSLIREAHAGGMSNTQIAKNMGINRGTVIAVLGSDDEDGQP